MKIEISTMTVSGSLPPHDDPFYKNLTFTKYVYSKKYTVKYFSSIPCYTCTCPDFHFKRRHTWEMCKHIEVIKKLDDVFSGHQTYERHGIECLGLVQPPVTENVAEDPHRKVESVSGVQENDEEDTTSRELLTRGQALGMVKDLVSTSKQLMTCIDTLVLSMSTMKVED